MVCQVLSGWFGSSRKAAPLSLLHGLSANCQNKVNLTDNNYLGGSVLTLFLSGLAMSAWSWTNWSLAAVSGARGSRSLRSAKCRDSTVPYRLSAAIRNNVSLCYALAFRIASLGSYAWSVDRVGQLIMAIWKLSFCLDWSWERFCVVTLKRRYILCNFIDWMIEYSETSYHTMVI